MAEQDFLVFSGAGGSNVLTQAEWLALSEVSTGFVSGILPSTYLNKALRQSSIIAAAVADFIVAQTSDNVIDDGTTATILANFTTAITTAAGTGIPTLMDTGSANALAVTFSPVPSSLSALAGKLFIVKKSAANNTTAVTINPNGLGATSTVVVDGSQFVTNQWPANAYALVLCNGTEFVVMSITDPSSIGGTAIPF